MKSTLALSFLLLGLTPNLADAQIRLPNFKTLCRYESACHKAAKMKDDQLIARPPSPTWIEYYKPLRGLIVQIAQEYQIDPVTLALTPIAENTMNVNSIDKVQDELEAQGMLDDDGSVSNPALRLVYDKPMSIGPGQIYVFAAKKVEPLAALIENRPVRTKKQIKAALKTRQGALRYAAAIIRDAQEVYARGGIDISRRPEILATLYNIGKVSDRLRNAKGRAPYPNYFGYFVGLNYRVVQEQLQLPSILDQN